MLTGFSHFLWFNANYVLFRFLYFLSCKTEFWGSEQHPHYLQINKKYVIFVDCFNHQPKSSHSFEVNCAINDEFLINQSILICAVYWTDTLIALATLRKKHENSEKITRIVVPRLLVDNCNKSRFSYGSREICSLFYGDLKLIVSGNVIMFNII